MTEWMVALALVPIPPPTETLNPREPVLQFVTILRTMSPRPGKFFLSLVVGPSGTIIRSAGADIGGSFLDQVSEYGEPAKECFFLGFLCCWGGVKNSLFSTYPELLRNTANYCSLTCLNLPVVLEESMPENPSWFHPGHCQGPRTGQRVRLQFPGGGEYLRPAWSGASLKPELPGQYIEVCLSNLWKGGMVTPFLCWECKDGRNRQ